MVIIFIPGNLAEYLFRETSGNHFGQDAWRTPTWKDDLWVNQNKEKELAIQRYESTEFQVKRWKSTDFVINMCTIFPVFVFAKEKHKINCITWFPTQRKLHTAL